MDLPEPAGSTALREAMAAAREHFDTDAERRLLEALAAAELLVPLVTDEATGRTVAARLAGERDTQALVAFTHPAAAEAFLAQTEVQIGVMPATALAATVADADVGLVLDPAGPEAGQLDRRALESLAAAASVQADGSAGLELRAPAEPLPADLVEALRAAVTTAPTLREAWHAEVVGAGPDHGLLVLVGDGEEPPASITDLLTEALPDGEAMDLLPVEAAAWDDGEYAQVSAVARLV